MSDNQTQPSSEVVSKEIRVEGDHIVVEQIGKTVSVTTFEQSTQSAKEAAKQGNLEIEKLLETLQSTCNTLTFINKFLASANDIAKAVDSDVSYELFKIEDVMNRLEGKYAEITGLKV